MIDLKEYGEIEYDDFTKTIWRAGFKLTDLNRRLNKSQSYFTTCGWYHTYSPKGERLSLVKPRLIVETAQMIGEELFIFCYEAVLKDKEIERLRREKRIKRGIGRS
jgi:hypothetical protein